MEYKISTFQSKYNAYWKVKQQIPMITFYVSTLWKSSENDFDTFVDHLIFLHILERICLERRFQHIRMKNRCKPCKMWKYAQYIQYCINKNNKEEVERR